MALKKPKMHLQLQREETLESLGFVDVIELCSSSRTTITLMTFLGWEWKWSECAQVQITFEFQGLEGLGIHLQPHFRVLETFANRVGEKVHFHALHLLVTYLHLISKAIGFFNSIG